MTKAQKKRKSQWRRRRREKYAEKLCQICFPHFLFCIRPEGHKWSWLGQQGGTEGGRGEGRSRNRERSRQSRRQRQRQRSFVQISIANQIWNSSWEAEAAERERRSQEEGEVGRKAVREGVERLQFAEVDTQGGNRVQSRRLDKCSAC